MGIVLIGYMYTVERKVPFRPLIALTLGWLLTASPAIAQIDWTPDYVGARGGTAATTRDSDDVTRSLRRLGHNVTASLDRHDWGAAVYAGYQLRPHLAVEAGLVRQGRFDVAVTGSTSDPARLRKEIGKLLSDSGTGAMAALRGRWMLNQDYFVSSRLAVHIVRGEVEIRFQDDTDTFHDTVLGLGLSLGAGVALSPGFDLGLVVEYYEPHTGRGIHGVGVQLQRHF